MASGQEHIDRAEARYLVKAELAFTHGWNALQAGAPADLVINRLRRDYRAAWHEAVESFPVYARSNWMVRMT